VVRDALISCSSRNHAPMIFCMPMFRWTRTCRHAFGLPGFLSVVILPMLPLGSLPGELTKWLGASCVSPLVPSLFASGRCVVPGLFDPLAEPATSVLSGDSLFQTSQ
jgi:hypothetical protein